ncbi:MAG: hypothetical protein BXU00_00450 [Candidatus Nanoclepta minutus]|uniref:Ribosomal RNA methyltransferase FtsJ domain-containing protein n=1 Tax=Candidatus Nanoclepta minutus TaxID=1940235 RepID=A0A397WNB6_9ARCH|nr:MAG: hypothetical protein BXU00_00450 [Candidatus Nanoclepta minutus]
MINVSLLSQKHEIVEAILEIMGYSPTDYYKIKRDIFLFNYSFDNPLDALSFIKKLYSSYLSVFINRYFITDSQTNKLNDILRLPMGFLRVVVFPKSLEKEILETLEKNNVKLSPIKFDWVLFIVNLKGEYYYGLFPKEYFVRKKEFRTISRAYYKIVEAIDRFKIPINLEWKALDIGAAPGSWSDYLSQKLKLVVAVDPAELKIKRENIIHIKKKIEDSFEDLDKYKPFNLVTCDMNQDPREVAKILLKLSPFLNNPSYMIMTIKLIYKGKRAKERLIKETLDILKEKYKVIGIKKLVANHEELTVALKYET